MEISWYLQDGFIQTSILAVSNKLNNAHHTLCRESKGTDLRISITLVSIMLSPTQTSLWWTMWRRIWHHTLLQLHCLCAAKHKYHGPLTPLEKERSSTQQTLQRNAFDCKTELLVWSSPQTSLSTGPCLEISRIILLEIELRVQSSSGSTDQRVFVSGDRGDKWEQCDSTRP